MPNLIIKVNNANTEPKFDLEKVPDDVLLKYANIEIGQLKAYIGELEENLGIAGNKSKPRNILEENKRLVLENKVLENEIKKLKRRKGDPTCDVNILLSTDDKLRLKEVEYKNVLVMSLKREKENFKDKCKKLNIEKSELINKNFRLAVEVTSLTRMIEELQKKDLV